MHRNDIAIVLVSVDVANRIRPVMNKFKNSLIPNILEIPSKEHPYNVEDDDILKMAAVILFLFTLIIHVNWAVRLTTYKVINKAAVEEGKLVETFMPVILIYF